MFNKVKGTQDFLDLTLYNFIIETIRKQLTLYHFTEIATPILEPSDLFKRGLGTETDVVSKEMFTINSGAHKQASEAAENESICLRPEATAAIVRAFIENGIQQAPWKVFLHGPMFRYERPQKGRYRQFHQISMEIIGSNSIAQDAQFICMLDRYFHEKLQLNNFAILINFIGCFEDRVAYKVKLNEFLQNEIARDICDLCKIRKETNILRIFDCKNPVCQKIYQDAPFIADNVCAPCASEWQQLKDQLDFLSVSYAYKPTLVRGLDYYNKTVFEFVSDNLGAQNAFCGGGRYDQLVAQLGGKQDQPSIGAAIGIERLILLLEPLRDKLPIAPLPALHVIIPVAKEQQSLALLVADELYAADLCTQVLLEGDSMKSMMRQANKMGASYCIILGDEEQKSRTATVKNMTNAIEERMPQTALISYLKK
jgi:histidyl-tRNA synthetase